MKSAYKDAFRPRLGRYRVHNRTHNRTLDAIRYFCIILCMMLMVAACGRGSRDAEAEPTNTPEPAPTEVPAEPEPEPTEVPQEEAGATHDDDAADAETSAANVFFRMPTNNAIVPPTFSVTMGATGVAVDPAGEIIENSGHMHILVNQDFIPAGEVIPNDERHIHYGDASLATELTLPVGSHTLRLQLANGAHIALDGDEYRDEIVVTVREGAPEQSVRFSSPLDGAVVPSSFDAHMAVAGLLVDPAGEIVEGSGHLHILLDTDFIPAGEVIPNDATHLHYGKAQLQAPLVLEPGEHTLRLQFANGAHIALDGDQYRDEITITVEEDAASEAVQFVMPEDGAMVDSTFDVQMSAAGLFVEGAGAVLREEGGHMHILVDTDFIEAGNVIPKDEQHIHFGGGQTMAELTLEPGEHTLRLQMANGAHIAMDGEQYRAEITVTVDESSANVESDSNASTDSDAGSAGDTAEAAADVDAEDAATVAPAELWTSMTCSACHNLNEAQSADNIGQPGPHMGNLYEVADTRVDGQDALEYVIASIVEPNAFVNEGYVANVMPQNFAEKMSEAEIEALALWILDPDRTN